MDKNVHHKKHRNVHHKKSRFSLFKHKVSDVFKEIVEPPCEEVCETPEQVIDVPENVVPEEVSVGSEEVLRPFDHENDVEHKEFVPREVERSDSDHSEIVSALDSAVSEWKKTGEVGLHLEPPVPFSSKFKSFLSKIKPSVKFGNPVSVIAEKLAARKNRVVLQKVSLPKSEPVIEKEHVESKVESDVAEKPVSEPVKSVRSDKIVDDSGKSALDHMGEILKTVKTRLASENPEKVIDKDWHVIEEKTGYASSFRAEIEKIYKELSTK